MGDELFKIDDPNDVIGRVFAQGSQRSWDSFRDMVWLLGANPYPAESEVSGITVGRALGAEPVDFIAPFNSGFLIYYVDQRVITLVDVLWVD